jgi:ATP-dependent Lon protease
MAKYRRILVVTQRRSAADDPTAADLYGVGLTASVTDLFKLEAHWQMPSPLSSRATSDKSKAFWRPVMWSRGCKRFSL